MANRYALQQVDIDILRQYSKDITIRIDILNSDDKVIDSIEGVIDREPCDFSRGRFSLLKVFACLLHFQSIPVLIFVAH